jgi:hypothetical protein
LYDFFTPLCIISKTFATFQPDIAALAAKNDMSVEETIAELKHRYDGYHFSKQTEGIYKPFSLLNCFADKDFGNLKTKCISSSSNSTAMAPSKTLSNRLKQKITPETGNIES